MVAEAALEGSICLAATLLRAREAELLVLLGPLCRRVTKTAYSNPARQPTFDRRFHEFWREKGKRDRHVDASDTATLACCDCGKINHVASDNFIEPFPAF